MRISASVALAVALTAAISTAVSAAETHYGYDGLGRLVQVNQSTPNQSHTIALTYDPAGNRRTQVVQGSPNGSATTVIVTPLGSGFAVIPIDRQR